MKKKPLDFTEAFKELEDTVSWFEAGTPDVEEGLRRFASAMDVAKELRERLEQAENKIKEIRQSHEVKSTNQQLEL
jgi:exodeoxyribonuclease VII small subunit